MPGPGVELIGAEETAEVMEVLQSGFLSRYGPSDNPAFGAKVHRIEGEIAHLSGVRYGLGLRGGGSAALWIALLGLGVGAGDEVIVPGFTYVASISAIVYTGATPVLAEVDQSFDLDPADVEARITPRTAAIIVVHMLGGPARMTELKAVADRHGIPLIEDCAQAFGATYKGQAVGGIGAAGTFSLQRVQDDHLRRRRDDRDRRRDPLRAVLRDARPGPRARPARVEVRAAAVPGHELPDDRAVRGRAPGPGPQARPDHVPPAGQQGDRQGRSSKSRPRSSSGR